VLRGQFTIKEVLHFCNMEVCKYFLIVLVEFLVAFQGKLNYVSNFSR